MSWDRMTVQISVRQTTAATGGRDAVQEDQLGKVAQRQRAAAEDGNAEFTPQNFRQVVRLNITDGHAADDGGGTLAARVAACVSQHGDVGGQHGHSGQCVLVSADDHAGEGGADH